MAAPDLGSKDRGRAKPAFSKDEEMTEHTKALLGRLGAQERQALDVHTHKRPNSRQEQEHKSRVDPAGRYLDGNVMAQAPALPQALLALLADEPGAQEFARDAIKNATGEPHVPQLF
jgi:hypothetical protein